MTMVETRHDEYLLHIAGPSAHDLTNYLTENHGWVFSEVGQDSFFTGHAIGYCMGAPARNYEGFAISTDQTRVARIEPLNE